MREVVRESQEVLWYPNYNVNIESNIFQQAMLGYGYLQAKKNPAGKTLREVLDRGLYERWAAAKAQYLPHNSSVEKKASDCRLADAPLVASTTMNNQCRRFLRNLPMDLQR